MHLGLAAAISLALAGCGGGTGGAPAPPTVSAQRWGAARPLATAEVTPRLGGPNAVFTLTMNKAGDTAVVFDNLEHFGAPSLVAVHYDARSRSWGEGAVLVGGASGSATTPSVHLAIDASGNAVVLWNQSEYSAAERNVYASRFDVRLDTWAGVARLTDPANDTYAQHVAANDRAGVFAALRRGGQPSLLARHYSGEWPSAVEFELGPAADFSGSRLASDATGNVIATWAEPGATAGLPAANDLASRRYSQGAGWQAKLDVPLGSAVDPAGTRTIGDLAIGSSGEAFLLWHDWLNTGRAQIYASRYDSGAGWGAPTKLDTADLAVDSRPVDPKRVSANDRGLVLATWGPRFSRYKPDEGWGPPVPITSLLATGLEGNEAAQQQMGLDAAGNVLAIGREPITKQPSFATYVFGRGWSAVSPLDSTIAYDYTPFLTANSKGRAVIVWAESLDPVPVACGSFSHCTAPTRVRLWARFYE